MNLEVILVVASLLNWTLASGCAIEAETTTTTTSTTPESCPGSAIRVGTKCLLFWNDLQTYPEGNEYCESLERSKMFNFDAATIVAMRTTDLSSFNLSISYYVGLRGDAPYFLSGNGQRVFPNDPLWSSPPVENTNCASIEVTSDEFKLSPNPCNNYRGFICEKSGPCTNDIDVQVGSKCLVFLNINEPFYNGPLRCQELGLEFFNYDQDTIQQLITMAPQVADNYYFHNLRIPHLSLSNEVVLFNDPLWQPYNPEGDQLNCVILSPGRNFQIETTECVPQNGFGVICEIGA